MAQNSNEKDYTEICSTKTLQTKSEGFFMNFVSYVSENAGKKWMEEVYGKLKTDKDRFRSIYNHEQTKQPISEVLSNVQEIYKKKNADISRQRRLEGEIAFKEGNTQKALVLLSQSVLRAPKTGENKTVDNGLSLAYALWKRSSVLIKNLNHNEALADLQMSLKEKLPKTEKPEAFHRMGVCYRALGDENRAKVSFELARKLHYVEKASNIREESKSFKGKDDISKEVNKVLPTVDDPNPNLSTASKKICVKFKKELGRHLVASDEIKTGETLVVEPPYSACLFPEMFGTHCQHCFDRLVAPVGCPDCSGVAFCAPECRDAALSTYHKYECKFSDLLIGSGMSVLSHVALRIITERSLTETLTIYKNKDKEGILKLCSNSEKRSANDFFQRTLMAAFLLECLRKSGYFGNGNDAAKKELPNEDELKVGELMLFHLQMLQFNAHEISETRLTTETETPNGCRIKRTNIACVGVGIYPTAALFNHDCYPGVHRYFVGKNIVIKSSRPHSRGETVAENYGPIFTKRTSVERQRSLSSRYWFECNCDACKYDWPSSNAGLDGVSKRIRCPNKTCANYFTLPSSKPTVKCPKCQKNVDINENIELLNRCEEMYKNAFKLMDEGKTDEAVTAFSSAIDQFHSVSCPPNKTTHLAQEALQNLMALSGNVFVVKKH